MSEETLAEKPRRGVRLAVVTVVVLAALLAGGGVWLRSTRAASEEARATEAALATGRFAEAFAAASRWVGIAPRSPAAHFARTRAAVALARPPAAVEGYYDAARAAGVSAPNLALLRAVVDAAAGRHAQAEPILRRAVEITSGTDPQYDEALARVYLETYNLHRAGLVINRWMQVAPDDAKPYLWRAEIDRRTTGPNATLVNDFQEALKRDPKLARAHLGLAEVLRHLHRCEEAKPEYEAYLKERPDDPVAHLGAGRNARELGDDDAADRAFARVLELDPKNADAHREIAAGDIRAGRLDQALEHLNKAIALDGFDVDSRFNRGLVLGRLGKAEQARAEQKAAATLREELTVLNDLKDRLLRTPNDPDLESRISAWMFDHGHDDGGVQWAEKVVRTRPDHPGANRLLADYYRRKGNAGLANFYALRAGPATETR